MTMTKNTEALDTRATEYHSIYPHCADFDLSIFKSMCEGKAADTIAAEQICSISSVSASLNRLTDYLTSGDLFSFVEIYRHVFYNSCSAIPASNTMLSVIDTLYYAASDNGMVPIEETQDQFSKLFDLTEQMPPEVGEEIIHTVCALCDIFEYASFTEGVKIGFQLGKEMGT